MTNTTTKIPTFTTERALRLIKAKSIQGEYHVSGSLYLSGCDLTGVTLPTTISGSLYLSGAKNPDPAQWWREQGETTKRHCIAVCAKDGYTLIQTDTDRFFAGFRSNFTRKQALAHWGKRTDARAQLFIAAIAASELPS